MIPSFSIVTLFAPMLRSLPHLIAAAVSVLAAVALSGVPWNLGVILAALLAMIAGAQAEFCQRRRQARHRDHP